MPPPQVARVHHPHADTLADEDVVARVCGGERALFELLVRRHNQRLYRVTRSILRDDAEAEDAVQGAHIAAYLKLDHFEGRSRYATWLTRIAVREALTRKRRRRELLVEQPAELTLHAAGSSPEGAAMNAELGRVLEAAIDTLPEEFRIVFMMRAVQELSTAETADCLGIPEATVKTRLFRARKLLRTQLGEQVEALLHPRVDEATPRVHAFAGDRCDRITAAVMARVLDGR